MRLTYRRVDLALRHTWAIASDLGQGGGKSSYPIVVVDLTDASGRHGIGEASPSSQYQESHATVSAFLAKVDPTKLSFDDIPGSMAYLETLEPGRYPAKCALNLALLDGASRAAGQPLCDYLGLGFTEGRHQTSFTIGIDTPEMMARKTAEAVDLPVLKLKLGSPADRENFAAVRSAAPKKPIRVDANQAWRSAGEALAHMEWLANDGNIEFIEQPMPADMPEAEWVWLKERSPLPLVADESYQGIDDLDRCARCFHGVNVKLVKTGGVSAGRAALAAARERGLRTMLGCMIESSILISAAAHLAELTDYLDLDGNLLITNDPYSGVRCVAGWMSFTGVAEATGLRVSPRA